MFALAIAEPDDLSALQERLGTGVTLLADPVGEAVEAFGVLDPGPFPQRRIARSASFLVDGEGRILRRWTGSSYRQRPAPDEVLNEIRERG